MSAFTGYSLSDQHILAPINPKYNDLCYEFQINVPGSSSVAQCTEVRFASLFSGGFTIMAVINPPEKKQANRTSVQYLNLATHYSTYVVM